MNVFRIIIANKTPSSFIYYFILFIFNTKNSSLCAVKVPTNSENLAVVLCYMKYFFTDMNLTLNQYEYFLDYLENFSP